MYKVCIYNNGVETIIHYPTADKDAPHLDKLPLKEGLSQVDSLSFSIYPNNPGYNELFELTTKIKAIDVRDGTVRFSGRVLNTDEQMDSSGVFFKNVICEGALGFLNDTKQRANTFTNTNPKSFLTSILGIHNGKVDTTRRIQVGDVNVTGGIAYTCKFETTLATILTLKEKIGGVIRVRDTNGVLYLDWLDSLSDAVINITLGENMKDMVVSKDITSLGTRIIPLGANNLTIAEVNHGIDYIEDGDARSVYGVIEKTVEYRDIENAQDLYNICLMDLDKYTQPIYVLQSNASDLSYITGNKAEQFVIGSELEIYNPLMAVDSIYKIVAMDLDLLAPYDPKLTIANRPETFSSTVNDLRKTSIQNNGVYNNVQVGDVFGIRAVRSDGKVTTTINAIEGISIDNETGKVFFVDTNGNLVAKQLRTNNNENYIILEDQYIKLFKNDSPRLNIGFMDVEEGVRPGITIGDDGACLYLVREEDHSAIIGNVTAMFGNGAHIVFSADDETIDIIATNVNSNGIKIATEDDLIDLASKEDLNNYARQDSDASFNSVDVYGGVSCNSISAENNAHIYGSLTVEGVKNAYVKTDNYGKVLLVCDESPNAVFCDRGKGEIGPDGVCIVQLDPIYLETVNTSNKDYYIKLTGIKTNDVVLDSIDVGTFTVTGTPGTKFLWKVEAERLGYEGKRFQTLNTEEGK